jgi:twitching motility protein PilI
MRRTRLREFQTQLADRMQAARDSTETRANHLGVMMGDTHCLLDLQEASEIIAVGAITAVPLTQDWYLGLSNIRGKLFSVIDFARFQGQAPTAITADCRIIAFAPALSFNSALLVSRVLGLRNVAEMTPEASGNSAPERAAWTAQRYCDAESRVWTQLKLSLMVQDPRFLHVGL